MILTKLDETMRIGNVLSCLARQRTPIAYLCDGQGVPQDLEEATPVRLLMNMEGFRIDREALEEKFSAAAAEIVPQRATARVPAAPMAAAAAAGTTVPQMNPSGTPMPNPLRTSTPGG